MSPLEALIRASIAENGPMPVSDYMALCLGHPEHGYYRRRDPLGSAGDFVTAPEVSQLFGEMIGGWIVQVWFDAGQPDFVLAELGPGRGTLMADALRVAERVSGFRQAVSLCLMETSPVLRAAQAAKLKRWTPHWVDTAEELPNKPLLVVANEFFDALPVAQYLRLDQGWQERVVTIVGDRLQFGFGPAVPSHGLDARFPGLADGTLVEANLIGETVAREIGQRVVRSGIAALVVDYGEWDGTGDTLQAVAGHHFTDPLDGPGETDLTTHVRFRGLAEASGLKAWGPLPQGIFLERLGITARARRLAGAGGEAAEQVSAGHRRLTSPEEMGHLFKVMALTGLQAPSPPGFEAGPRE